MQLAVAGNGERIKASKGAEGYCPGCKSRLIPKCGEIVVHHWAHEADDCDPWSEGETEWHAAGKALFPEPYREVVIGSHRADVAMPGRIIEFQGQSLSPAEIREREEFFGPSLVWVAKLDDAADRISFRPVRFGDLARWFYTWRIPRPTWGYTGRTLYMDLGTRYFRVERHRSQDIGWGFGVFLSKAAFVKDVKPVSPSLFDLKEIAYAPR